MRKQQQIALCVCNFVIYSGIGGLVGLMPVYLSRLGADATVTGFFLAFAYLSLALSNIVGGRLSDRFQRRKGFLIRGGVLAFPITWLMSQTTSIGLLFLLMACLWFLIGIPMTLVNIMTGLFSEAANRGRRFGVLSQSAGLGLFFGGLVSGPIVDLWGFPALFVAFAFFYFLIPLAGGFVQDRVTHTGKKIVTSTLGSLFSNRTFTLLFIASILAQAANIIIFLSRPLLMDAFHFEATAISSANAIGSLVTLPLPLLAGWLADRVGRKPLLVACFLAPTLGLIVQAAAVEAWHFSVSSMLATVIGVSTVVGSALITDIFSEASLSKALSLLNATPWIGIVLGLSAGGLAIRVFEMTPALMVAALLGLVALFLLIPISEHEPEYLLQSLD
jgi:MFS transporter, DHA1 family, multidrug resistance protein